MATKNCTYNLYDNCYVVHLTKEEQRAREQERKEGSEVLKACRELNKELQKQEERENWLYM